jgi:carbonic anhydrase
MVNSGRFQLPASSFQPEQRLLGADHGSAEWLSSDGVAGGDVRELPELFENNRRWAADRIARQPDFFARLKAQQAPKYLWIGCSDSRVPANEIVGLQPGELFVHRNVANVVVHTDLNCLSVLQYAVDVLKVAHVIVCGHYGCGGVRAALDGSKQGLIDNWLRHVQDVHAKHHVQVDNAGDLEARANRLCEVNVLEQAMHVCKTTVVQDAWDRGQPLAVHAWIYGLEDGRLRDLGFGVTSSREMRQGLITALNSRPEVPQG